MKELGRELIGNENNNIGEWKEIKKVFVMNIFDFWTHQVVSINLINAI